MPGSARRRRKRTASLRPSTPSRSSRSRHRMPKLRLLKLRSSFAWTFPKKRKNSCPHLRRMLGELVLPNAHPVVCTRESAGNVRLVRIVLFVSRVPVLTAALSLLKKEVQAVTSALKAKFKEKIEKIKLVCPRVPCCVIWLSLARMVGSTCVWFCLHPTECVASCARLPPTERQASQEASPHKDGWRRCRVWSPPGLQTLRFGRPRALQQKAMPKVQAESGGRCQGRQAPRSSKGHSCHGECFPPCSQFLLSWGFGTGVAFGAAQIRC